MFIYSGLPRAARPKPSFVSLKIGVFFYKNSFFKLIIVGFLGLSAAFCSAQSAFNQGVNYYQKRAETHSGLKVDSTNINLAITYFKTALKTNNEKSLEYLLECFYYKGAFVESEKSKQKQVWLTGKILGEKAVKAGLLSVVFDRNGYQYHGRIKSLAEGAREGGLKF